MQHFNVHIKPTGVAPHPLMVMARGRGLQMYSKRLYLVEESIIQMQRIQLQILKQLQEQDSRKSSDEVGLG